MNIWYFSFPVWLISLRIMSLRSIHVVENCKISFGLGLNNTCVCVFVCVCVDHARRHMCIIMPPFLYSFIHLWTLGLFSCLAYCKQCCNEHSRAVFSFSLAKYQEVELLDHMVVLFLIFWRNSIQFSIVTTQFTSSPTVYTCSLFWSFSSALVIYNLFDNSLFNRCEVISHCGFDLHLPVSSWF